MTERSTVLDQIVARSRQAVRERKEQRPVAELELLANTAESPRDFEAALRGGTIALIAEIKRASPSKGWLRANLDAGALARSYAQGGAAAISVLTEPTFFHGSFGDLSAVREAVKLPLLCKDFIFDRYQIYEARANGADAVLLIAGILSPSELSTLVERSHRLGLSALVEVHSQAEVESAIFAGARLIGINNRNLKDFSVDLKVTLELRPLIPAGIAVVSESGIHSHEDIEVLQAAGVNAILVGEALVTSPDPVAKMEELLAIRSNHRW
jgi:indole-3-glycerol phosphate synthase